MVSNDKLDSLSQLGGDMTQVVEELRDLRMRVTSATKPTIAPASPLRVGNNVFIRTVTVYQIGRVEAIDAEEIILSAASWVADTGRFHTALKTGILKEVEPFPSPISISRGSVVDVTDWPHPLPEVQK